MVLSEKSTAPYKVEFINKPFNSLYSLWMKADGSEGWAVGGVGTFLHYNKSDGNWKPEGNDLISSDISDLWMKDDGSEGWVLVGGGGIAHYSKATGCWKPEWSGAYLTILNNLWMKPDGSEGWVVGDNGMIEHYDRTAGTWSAQGLGLTDKSLNRIWMKADASEGWIVGDEGIILHYDKKANEWEVENTGLTDYTLSNIWMNENGNEGWAIGDKGVILHYNKTDGGWKMDDFKPTVNDLSSLWMNTVGDDGWMVGDEGTILHYDKASKHWNIDSNITIGSYLSTLSMKSDGSEGWAFGSRGTIARYTKYSGGWKIVSAGLTDNELFSFWVQADGSEGWAVGDKGTILQYNKTVGEWKSLGTQMNRNDLNDFWIKADNSDGWAIGGKGTILHYDKPSNRWQPDGANITNNNLKSLWVKANGEEGWAIGDTGVILHYEKIKHSWKSEGVGITHSDLQSIWMKADGNEGWAVGNEGIILHYEKSNGGWKIEGNGITENTFENVWMKDDVSEGWALTSRFILHYDKKNGGWITKGTGETDEFLNKFWMKANGNEGWAIGSNATMLHYDRSRGWKATDLPLRIEDLLALSITEDGEEGWAVGRSGVILHYKKEIGAWMLEPESTTGDDLTNICMKPDGREGWATGPEGTILHYERKLWTPINLGTNATINKIIYVNDSIVFLIGQHGLFAKVIRYSPSDMTIDEQDIKRLADLNGKITLHFNEKIAAIENINILGFDNLDLKKDTNYTVSIDTTGYKVVLQFEKTNDITQRYLHSSFKLQLQLKYSNAISKTAVIVQTKRSFTISGTSLISRIFWVFTVFIGLNIILVLLAIQFRFARWLVLHPLGSQIIGLVVGKYLITAFLIHFVSPIRLALFKTYRRQLNGSAPYIKKWRDGSHSYTPPTVLIEDDSEITNDKEAWEQIIEYLLKSPKNVLWLLIGRSGLGKTALLEKWTEFALGKKATPIFIRLGEQDSLIDICQISVQQYGDIILSNDSLLDIFKWGGFIFFIDGLNEALEPGRVLEFIRKIIKKNTVILSGQQRPDALNDLNTRNIALQPFGIAQLGLMIGKVWAEKALKERYLSEILALPQTANLLKEYIIKNNRLPSFGLEVYADLLRRNEYDTYSLGILKEQLNLKAWELFASQSINFHADENILPLQECAWLCYIGIFSKSGSDFRFRHERIQKYFVACYIFRDEPIDIKAWNAKLLKGQPYNYWSDVVEFLAEMFVYKIYNATTPEIRLSTQQFYHDYVLDVDSFYHPLFKSTVFPQYHDYYKADLIAKDPEFYEILVEKYLDKD